MFQDYLLKLYSLVSELIGIIPSFPTSYYFVYYY